MNVYIITEGKTEANVYRHWIPLINSELSIIDNLSDLEINNFYIISARGYPFCLEIIQNAIADVNGLNFNRLVVCCDSEDFTKEERYDEIKDIIDSNNCLVETKIVVQFFCFETWALGNRKIIGNNIQSLKLRDYIDYYNVKTEDPEQLPSKSDEGLNRSQFAKKYLRIALNDKFRNLTFSKRNPKALVHNKYYDQVKKRFDETSHIESFGDFLRAFL